MNSANPNLQVQDRAAGPAVLASVAGGVAEDAPKRGGRQPDPSNGLPANGTDNSPPRN